jgi:hypothetical protein
MITPAPRPSLRLIAADSTNPKAKIPTMKTPAQTEDEKAARVRAMIQEACTASTRADPGPTQRRRTVASLEDHVLKVRNAIAAVCVLAQSTQVHGEYPNGEPDTLQGLGRNHFVDLLEILGDRLSTALDIDIEGERT